MSLPLPPNGPAEEPAGARWTPPPEQPPYPPPGYGPPAPPPPQYPYPPPGGPYAFPQAAPPPRRRSKAWVVVLAVVAAIVLVCGIGGIVLIAGGGDSTQESAPQDENPAVPAGENPGVGDEARDGKFAFTVTSLDQGLTQVGGDYLQATAQGEFLLVSLTVVNIGEVPQTFADDAQRLFDTGGREFSPDATADLYLNEDSLVWLEEINPGNEIQIQIAFDVPEGTVPARIELHDSPFSGGVTVDLA